ncbi:putative CoA-substrate-specific enzyme activase [Desulfohalotomaculum tongense]|nr:putative CoA-substrate-specific enzyme activase [Desulforadius tongensis]
MGSTAAKAVLLKDKKILGWAMIPTGWSPQKAGEEVLQRAVDAAGITAADIHRVVGTGYGRVALDFLDKAVTEISCHAMGANYYFPENKMVIDIGGQDSKVILVNKQGKVINFLMNDKCAAGTGRFLQVTVNGLGLELDQLDRLPPAEPVNINSMCTVFAESEVISLLAAGTAKESIVAGLLKSIAKRVSTMAGSIQENVNVTFTGGVAQNRLLREMLARELGVEVMVPPVPQIIGALGAAIIARNIG